MAFELPIYLQELDYPARMDRIMMQYVFRSTERVLEGLVVSQKATTQDSSVDITAGTALVMGDNVARQGMYLATSTDAEWSAGKVNFALPVKPGANQRRDLLVLRMRDSQALGSGVFDDAIWDVVSGTTAASNPPIPATPPSCLPVALILRTSGEGGVLNAAITDIAVRGPYPYGSGDVPPTYIGAPGDMFVEW